LLQDENFSICSLKSHRSHLYGQYPVRGQGHKVNDKIVVLRFGIILSKDLLFEAREKDRYMSPEDKLPLTFNDFDKIFICPPDDA